MYLKVAASILARGLGMISVVFSAGMLSAVQPLPIPESSVARYPFSTVGQVVSGGDVVASGVVVSSRVVLTSAQVRSHGNVDDLRFRASDGQYYRVSSVLGFSEYVAAMDPRDPSYADNLGRDILFLLFGEEVNLGDAAIWGSEPLDSQAFRMMVGYAPDRYGVGNADALRLHATGAGEAVGCSFEKVVSRFHRSDAIRFGRGLPGAGVFSFVANRWVLSGVYVSDSADYGQAGVCGVDALVGLLYDQAVNRTNSVVRHPDVLQAGYSSNGTWEGAVVLPLGHTLSATVHGGSISDFHAFDVASTGVYVVESFGSLDVSGSLYNAAGKLVSSNDDFGGSLNYRISALLEPGRYYVRTTPFSTEDTGFYGIRVQAESPSAVVYGDANTPPMGVIDHDLGSSEWYQIGTAGERDMFRFRVTQAGHVSIWTEGNMDMLGVLIAPNSGAVPPFEPLSSQRIWSVSDDASGRSGNVLLDAVLPAGDYVLILSARESMETGPYRLSIRMDTSLQASTEEDDLDDTFGKAVSASVSVMSGELSSGGDVDFVRIESTSTGAKKFISTGATDVVFKVFNEDFEPVGTWSADEPGVSSMELVLNRGYYFVRITGADPEAPSGSYRITIDPVASVP